MKAKIFICSIALFSLILISAIGSQESYRINGESVYIDDDNVYISVYPHTLQGSGYVYIDLRSKDLQGNIDLLMGFDDDIIKPRSIEYYDPHWEIVNKSYDCPYILLKNETYFWCYVNLTNNKTFLYEENLLFEHNYSELSKSTATWKESEYKYWSAINLDRIEYEYGEMSRWEQAAGLQISNKYETKKLRAWIEVPSLIKRSGKYWVAIKQSGQAFSSAITSKFYSLDPWWQGSSPLGYWKFNETLNSKVPALDHSGNLYNMTLSGNVTYVPGKLGNAIGNFSSLADIVGNSTFQAMGKASFTIAFGANVSGASDGIYHDFLVLNIGGVGTPGQILFYVHRDHTGNLSFQSNGGTEYAKTTTALINDSIPHRIVFIRDNSTDTASGKLYVDNVEYASFDIGTTENFHHKGIYVGNTNNTAATNAALSGWIDDLQVYYTAWSVSDVADDYNSGEWKKADSTTLNILASPLSPENNTLHNGENMGFQAVFNMTAAEHNVTNATLYIWNASFDLWKSESYTLPSPLNNATINISIADFNYTTYYWAFQGQGTDGSAYDIAWTENRTIAFNDTKAPNLTINSPTGTISSLSFDVNISAWDKSGLSYCYFNITRGASVEVANTQLEDCSNYSTSVSGDATYQLNVWVNDSKNNRNYSFETFIVSTSGGLIGGGGGGFFEDLKIEVTAKREVCKPLIPGFQEAYQKFRQQPTWESFIELWQSFWTLGICDATAELIPI